MTGVIADLMKLISGDSASPAGKLTKKDLVSVGMAMLDGCGSVILTVIQTSVVPALPPIPAMALNFVITKYIRKWISGNGIPAADQGK